MIVCGLVLVSCFHFSLAQTGTQVSGIITQDTTWTKTNSPYSLTGPVAVNTGATLTIQAGTTVNINNYYIQINGTLNARGTNTEQIYFYGGKISFTSVANGWNEQTGTGCIIKNANVISDVDSSIPLDFDGNVMPSNTLSVYSKSLISNNPFILNLNLDGSSSMVTNNTVAEITADSGSPTISNNTILGVLGPTASSYFAVSSNVDSILISNNNIFGTVLLTSSGGSATILGNTVTPKSYQVPNYPQPELFAGIILLGSSNYYVYNNFISGCSTAIDVDDCIIQNNTIANNALAIKLTSSVSAVINFNNLENNSQNIVLANTPNNVNATFNWWGTTDIVQIGNSIHDSKNDFNLGTVNFVPYLTAPNTQAVPNQNASMPTPSLSTTPVPITTSTQTPGSQTLTSLPTSTPTPNQTSNPTTSPLPFATPTLQIIVQFVPTWFYAIIAGLVAVIAVLLGVIIMQKRNKKGPDHA